MIRLAIKMIMGDRLKYLGLLIGLSFAAMLITQQASIFMGYTKRMWSFIQDTPHADVWVMDPQVRFTEDPKPIRDTSLLRVRAIEGVESAVPMYRNNLLVRLADGTQEMCTIIGVDDATLLGGPTRMLSGSLLDLRKSEGVIVDSRAAAGDLAFTNPDGSRRSLTVGDTLSINDRAARVVGICETNEAFYWQPVIYTTYGRALEYAPPQRKQLTYVLARVKPGYTPAEVARNISETTGLAARTREGFGSLTMWYTLLKTGILVNFGITVALGFVIGLLVCGQTFFTYVADNSKVFGALKALGVSDGRLLGMIGAQVVFLGLLGFGFGAGAAALSGQFLGKVGVGFYLPWQLLVGSCIGILCICFVSAFLASFRVLRLEPAIVFKG